MSAMPGLLVAVEDIPQLHFERRQAPVGDQVGAVLMQPAPSQGEQRHAVSNVGALPEGFGFPSSAPSPVSRVIWLVRSKNSAGHASAILIATGRSEEHTSNSSHQKISYAVFCLKKKKSEKAQRKKKQEGNQWKRARGRRAR